MISQFTCDIWLWVTLKGQIKVIGLCIIDDVLLDSGAVRPRGLLLSPAALKARDGRYCNAPPPVRLSVCLSVCPSVRPSVRPSVTLSFRTVTQKRIHLMYCLETLQVCAPCHGGVLYSFWYWWNVVGIFSSAVPPGSGAFEMPTHSSAAASASTLRGGRANLRNASVTFSLFLHEASLGWHYNNIS